MLWSRVSCVSLWLAVLHLYSAAAAFCINWPFTQKVSFICLRDPIAEYHWWSVASAMCCMRQPLLCFVVSQFRLVFLWCHCRSVATCISFRRRMSARRLKLHLFLVAYRQTKLCCHFTECFPFKCWCASPVLTIRRLQISIQIGLQVTTRRFRCTSTLLIPRLQVRRRRCPIGCLP